MSSEPIATQATPEAANAATQVPSAVMTPIFHSWPGKKCGKSTNCALAMPTTAVDPSTTLTYPATRGGRHHGRSWSTARAIGTRRTAQRPTWPQTRKSHRAVS